MHQKADNPMENQHITKNILCTKPVWFCTEFLLYVSLKTRLIKKKQIGMAVKSKVDEVDIVQSCICFIRCLKLF